MDINITLRKHSMENLHSLVYISIETKPFPEHELHDLLNKARAKNTALNITGMLLYNQGKFIQTLEGDKTVIKDLYNIIKQDKRHKLTIKVYESGMKTRSFSDWSMGFKKLDDPNAEVLGFSDIFTNPKSLENLKRNPSPIIDLLLKFKNKSI